MITFIKLIKSEILKTMKISNIISILIGLTITLFSCTTTTKEQEVLKVLVKQEDYGEKWPFTVNEGYVACEEGTYVIFIAHNVKYALNGTAQTIRKQRGYNAIDFIWKNDPKFPGLKIGYAPFLKLGNDLCR
jgi:hypothetical protein